MDLSAMLNDGPPPDKRPRLPSHSDLSRPTLGPAFPPTGREGSVHMVSHEQRTPLYAPPTIPTASSQSRTSTPLHTPSSQAHLGAQYPFPTQIPQSPMHSSSHTQQYVQHDLQSAITPGPRPVSHGLSYASHGNFAMGLPGTASQSPTPSSQHSQTSHTHRQSPLTTVMHLTNQQNPGPYQSQQSQAPNTPLGPPQSIPRALSYHDRTSPYHQRTLSGASNTMMLGSPAQRQASINHLVDSPSALQRPSPQRSSTNSEYLPAFDRERSVSVSPKTKVLLRTPSLHSHSSVTADANSSRGSQQPITNAILHSEAPVSQTQTTPGYPQLVHQRSANSHEGSAARVRSEVSAEYLGRSPPPESDQAGALYTTQKLGMNRLLTPSREHPMHGSSGETQMPQPVNVPLKRPAESESPSAVPHKRNKNRYAMRPIWAQLHPSNQRYSPDEQAAVPSRATNHVQANASTQALQSQGSQFQASQLQVTHQQPPPPLMPRQNGTTVNGEHDELLVASGAVDPNMISARRLVHHKWTRTMCRDAPISGYVQAVSNWLKTQLESLQDIGYDPLEGSIEIEAKIGTVFDTNTNDRVRFPALNPIVLAEQSNHHLRFESQMDEREHYNMNQFLNKTLQGTMTAPNAAAPDRTLMQYKHIYETDSFRPLSALGYQALPQSVQRHCGNDLKLRTTTDDKTNQVVARIVKIKIANLHICSPMEQYDCRITINVEVNLNRPDLDPNAITTEPSANFRSLDRKKDRLSYKHLVYSIDLTKVTKNGVPKASYELELEVEPNTLRQQMDLARTGQENAFRPIVEGFLDNMTILMRNGTDFG